MTFSTKNQAMQIRVIVEAIVANQGMVFSHRVGVEDSRASWVVASMALGDASSDMHIPP
jgi:hypothetical protein